MKTTFRFETAFWSITAALILTGCGGAPSESEIKATIEKQVQNQAQAMKAAGVAHMMKGLMPEIKNVKKIGCKDDGEKAYLCDVEMEVTQLSVTNKTVSPMRFVKGSDGWMLSNFAPSQTR